MYISEICKKKLKLSTKTSATVQVVLSVVMIIAMFIFADFFVTLSIYIAILYPLWLAYTYLFQNIYNYFQTQTDLLV